MLQQNKDVLQIVIITFLIGNYLILYLYYIYTISYTYI